MDLQLKGRHALVTGASMGIGRAIAKGLAEEGVTVAIVARRRELLDTRAEEIVRAEGPRPTIIVADVMAADAASRISGEALAGPGAVGILINSPGGSRPLPRYATGEAWPEAS